MWQEHIFKGMQFWNFKIGRKITLIIILISLITPQPSLKTQCFYHTKFLNHL